MRDKMVNDEFYIGLWLGHNLAQDLSEAYNKKFNAHPGEEMMAANEAIDEVVDTFKAQARDQIQTEYELNRDGVPALTQQDATDCMEILDEMVDSVVYSYSDEPLLPALLGVLGR